MNEIFSCEIYLAKELEYIKYIGNSFFGIENNANDGFVV